MTKILLLIAVFMLDGCAVAFIGAYAEEHPENAEYTYPQPSHR